VAVHADLSPDALTETKAVYGKPVVTDEESEKTVEQRSRPGHEPGVNPNVSVQVDAGGGGDKLEKSRSRTSFDGKADETVTRRDVPRHVVEGLSASVNVPRSFLAGIFKRENPDKEPTDEEIEARVWPALREKIIAQAQGALKTETEMIKVAWFPDDAMTMFGVSAEETALADGMMGYVHQYGGTAGMAGLAVLSLFMMLMMVRKAGEGPVLPGEAPPKRKASRGARSGEDDVESIGLDVLPVGEAAATDGAMVGLEIDEQTLQTQQIVEQIANMVKDDPKASIGIIERWIESD
jgi:flagellar biosynthesis/type III secretory pathway M-ring protein FliF/YscJ